MLCMTKGKEARMEEERVATLHGTECGTCIISFLFFFGCFIFFFGGGGELGRRNINLAIHFVSEGDTTRAKKTRELRGNTSRLRGWRWMNGWPHNAFPSDFFRFFCLDILCWLSGV